MATTPDEVLTVGEHRYSVTRAREADVAELAALLADDMLGSGRESAELSPYLQAFREIDADPRQYLAAVRGEGDAIVGTLQLTLIPGLSRSGTKRLLIEGVRLASSTRGSGLGTVLFAWAHDYGRRHGATLAQLTSDKQRTDALRFYERLGYTASHEGFKRPL